MIVIETFGRWMQPRAPPHATATNQENCAMIRHGMVQRISRSRFVSGNGHARVHGNR